MCGIIGYIGPKKTLMTLIDGLKKLEYRGYDSAGIAYAKDNKINIIKSVGKIKYLEEKIEKDERFETGIGHTRWATHGIVKEDNSHPHKVGKITIVHNGILENYQQLRNFLLVKGYKFTGDTDTEVGCAYIDYQYKISKDKDMIKILDKCIDAFEGSYAMVVMVQDIYNKLFVLKKDSPLVVGILYNEKYIASDIVAFNDEIKKYIVLEDKDIGIITRDEVTVYRNGKRCDYTVNNVTNYDDKSDKGEYQHYMLKEIIEQIDLIKKLNNRYGNNILDLINIRDYKTVHIIGCGTAYYAGLIGKYLMENFSDQEINVYVASEYRYQKIFVNGRTLVIAVSQSGETADTLACIKRVKEYGCKTLGIINVKDSAIARIVDKVIYTEAGREIAVASTKAYLSQIYIFSLLAVRMGVDTKSIDINDIKKEYLNLPNIIEKLINYNYEEIIEHFWQNDDIFYLGRNIDYATVLEGALKIKEIAYIHSEAYQAGELKHGTISLIENGTCVIGLVTNNMTSLKTISNIKEVKARGAYVILVIKEGLEIDLDKDIYDEIIVIPCVDLLIQPIINVIPFQLMAYYVAKKRGCDIDKPRNLAKSVTVE